MATPKEPRFFVDAPYPAGRWSLGLDWYKAQFATAKSLCGEASPQYARGPSLPGVPERMAGVIPAAKLIYLVRNPMARLRSGYLMHAKHGTFAGSFLEYIEKVSFALDSSCYGRRLEEYLHYYAIERIVVIESQSLRVERLSVLATIFKFLGAAESFSTPLFFHTRNVGKMEHFPSRMGRRILQSKVMKSAEQTLHGGVYYHFRNLVLVCFSQPEPSTDLPAAKEKELSDLFRREVALVRKLTGLPLPTLGPS